MKAKDLIKKQLKKLEKNGSLTPRKVVDEARNESSPLHDYFDWDDSSAGEKYRLWQARQLIASVRVEFHGKEQNGYFNARVTVEDEKDRAYFSIDKVASDEEIYKDVLRSAIIELEYWKKKYQNIKELNNLINIEELNTLHDQIGD